MKGKNILVTVALVLGFGGLIANSAVGLVNNRDLKNDIEALRSDMVAADLAEEARITQAYEAQIAATKTTLENSIALVKADLETQLKATKDAFEEAIVAVREELSEQGRSLSNQIDSALETMLTELGKTNDKVAENEEDTLNYIIAIAYEFDDVLEMLEDLEANDGKHLDSIAELEMAVGSLQSLTSSMKSTLTVMVKSLQDLINNVNNNYITKAEATALVKPLNDLYDDILDMLKDADGKLMTVKDILAYVSSEFEKVNLELVDQDGRITVNEGAIEQLQKDVQNIQKELNAFYGRDALVKKSGYVNALALYYAMFDRDVIEQKYGEVQEFYGKGKIPAEFTEKFENLRVLYKTTLYALSEKGESLIILAADSTLAGQIEEQYEKRIHNYILEIDFMLARDKAIKALPDVTNYDTISNQPNFTAAIRDEFVNDLKAVEWDNAEFTKITNKEDFNEAFVLNTISEDQEAYYNDLIAKLGYVSKVAAAYKDIIDNTDTSLQAVKAEVISDTAKQYFYGQETAAVNFATFKSAVQTAGAYTSSSETNAGTFKTKVANIETLVEEGASEYATIVAYASTVDGQIDGITMASANPTSDKSYAKGKVDDEAALTLFQTFFDAVMEDVDDQTDVSSKKTTIGGNTTTQKTKMDNIKMGAEAYADLIGTYNTEKSKIGSLTNLPTVKNTAGTKTGTEVYQELLGDQVTIAGVLTATASFGAQQTSFDSYKTGKVADLTGITAMATAEDTIISDLAGLNSSIASNKSTNSSKMTPAQATAVYDNFFEKVAQEAKGAYDMLDAPMCGETTISAAKTAAETKSTNLKSDITIITGALTDFTTSLDACKAFPARLDAVEKAVKQDYLATHNNTNTLNDSEGDGIAAWKEYAVEIAAKKTAEKDYAFGVTGSTFTTPTAATGTYATDLAYVSTWKATFYTQTELDTKLQNYNTSLKQFVDSTVVAKYNELETAYVAKLKKDYFGTESWSSITTYQGLDASSTLKIAVDAKLSGKSDSVKADVIFALETVSIPELKAATSSADLEAKYAAALAAVDQMLAALN